MAEDQIDCLGNKSVEELKRLYQIKSNLYSVIKAECFIAYDTKIYYKTQEYITPKARASKQ